MAVDIRARADELLPGLVADLERLARIPSIAAEGFPPEPLFEAHDLVTDLLRDAGVEQIESLRIDGKTAPVVIGRVPGPPGAPTVLMYSHYDVVPAGDESLWETPPFEPVQRDGAIHGRGVADSKANIMAIIGAVQVFGGSPPVALTIVIEGQEEVGSPFDVYPAKDPGLFRADAIVVADVGNVRPGSPTLTTALRGSVDVAIAIRTLGGDKHSGQFGGAAPDARLAMIRLLASLHDADGDVAVSGLRREKWTGADYSTEEFRDLADVQSGVPLMGTGGLGERIWSGPAITVTAFDAPPATAPINAVASTAKAVVNLRVHPQQNAAEAQRALIDHLAAQRPFGIEVEITAGEVGNGVATELGGPAYEAAQAALGAAWGSQAGRIASGGSIPLAMAMHEAVPEAEVLLFGAIDGYAQMHAPNERVLIDELRNTVVANARFFAEFAARSAA